MRALSHASLWTLAPWLPLLACSSHDVSIDPVASHDTPGVILDPGLTSGTRQASLDRTLFPGGGTSGAAAPLSPALGPESSTECDPTPRSAAAPGASVQTVCFYGEEDLEVPAAAIEQIVEIVGTEEWVHIRLTLNPDFVDNTYGETAVGWDERDAPGDAPAAAPGADATLAPGAPPPDGPPPPEPRGPRDADAGAPDDAPPPPAPDAGAPPAPPPPGAGAPPAPPPPGAPPAPPVVGDDDATGPRPPGEPREPGARPGKSGHSFEDLLGSDHAELQLLDATGVAAMRFKIDYLSSSEAASSGYGSLGVSGGEGALSSGDPEWVLGSTTSLDRNLNACGLASFTESSPATDALYTPHPDASAWDYRVSYEIWVSAAAFGTAGFGSALIENVHASPSKAPDNTLTVLPAPCPADPDQPELAPAPLPTVLENIR